LERLCERTTEGTIGQRRRTEVRKVIVVEWMTLDRVVQAPGAPDEEPRGGFAHGGWADVQVRTPDADPVLAGVAAASAVTRMRRST
jgi:hypothetical protein